MKKILALFLIVFFAAFIYGLMISHYSIKILEDQIVPNNPPGFYDYRGVTHVHSTLSGGSSSQEKIIESAQEVNLDFLIFTELNYFGDAVRAEGYNQRLLVLQANEYSYLDSHVLMFDQTKSAEFDGLGEVQVVLSDILSKQAKERSDDFVVLSHPFKPGHQWQGTFPAGFSGLEVINLKSMWRSAWDRDRLSFFWTLLIYPFNPQLALIRLVKEQKRELNLWDSVTATAPTAGFVGNDTTARALPIGNDWLKFPTYQNSFEITSNHVMLRSELTGSTDHDRRKILSALKAGQFYMSVDLLGDPRGFYVEMKDRQKSYMMGSDVPLSDSLTLPVFLPSRPKVPFEIGLFRNGKKVTTANKSQVAFKIEKAGIYRVAVRVIPTFPLPDGKKWIPWIYSNPFYVTKK